MADINVRLAYKEDLRAMHRVELACFNAPWSYDAFAENFYSPFSIYALAEDDNGDVIGFGGMQVIFEEAHIMNIAVMSQSRRSGVGTRVLELMIGEAKQRGAEIMFLEVRVSNLAAIKLYEKFGFMPIGVRKNYYSDNNEDALIMTLEI